MSDKISLLERKLQPIWPGTRGRIISVVQLLNLLAQITLSPVLLAPIQTRALIFNRTFSKEKTQFHCYSQTPTCALRQTEGKVGDREKCCKREGGNVKGKKKKGKQGEIRTVGTIGLVNKSCQIAALCLFKVLETRNLDICIVWGEKKKQY